MGQHRCHPGFARPTNRGEVADDRDSPQLDFTQNRAEHDGILGEACEYLMRHFTTQSPSSGATGRNELSLSQMDQLILLSGSGVTDSQSVGRQTDARSVGRAR